MIKLVIFDLDGVIVDACEWHRVALNKALKEVCDYEISLEDHYSIFNGIPTRVKLSKLSEMGIVEPEQHKKIYERKQQLTIDTIISLAPYRQEKVDLINYLRKKGCYIACYTNSIRETATLMLDKTGVLEHMDYLITNQDVEKAKPDPEGYNFLVEKFNLKKQKVLIIEDSPKGKQAAHASGCKVLEVENPNQVTIDKVKEYFE
jgi:HAD superfamily hydrolase (TIGR01509 family)